MREYRNSTFRLNRVSEWTTWNLEDCQEKFVFFRKLSPQKNRIFHRHSVSATVFHSFDGYCNCRYCAAADDVSIYKLYLN